MVRRPILDRTFYFGSGRAIAWAGTLIGLFVSPMFAIQVAPTHHIFRLTPGEKQKAEFTLTNDEAGTITITPSFKKWAIYPDTKHITPGQWLSIDAEPFVLKPGETRVFPFRVEAPKKMKGEVMAMMSFTTKSEVGQSVTFILSVAVYVTIKGTERIDAKLASMGVDISSDTAVTLSILNTGNVHLRLNGWVEVLGEDNQPVMNVTYNDNKVFFPGLPNTLARTVSNFRLPEGKYSARITMTDTEHNVELVETRKFRILKNGVAKF